MYSLKKYRVTIIIFFTLLSCFSQKKLTNKGISLQGYEITINTQNLANETLQLALQYGTANKKLVTDSIIVKTSNQKVIFKQLKKIVGSIYRLELKSNPNSYIELALDNSSVVNVELPSTNSQTWTVVKNQLNIDFLAYQRLPKSEKPLLRSELIKKHPKTVLQLYLWAENKIDTPKSTDENTQQLFYTTFFNDVTLTEKRLAFLPNINKLLYKFVTSVPISNKNYIKHIDLLLNGMDCNTQNYSVFIKYFIANISFFESYNLEETYNFLYEKYIMKPTCKVFSDSESNKYNNIYDSNKKVPLNGIFPEVSFVKKDSTEVTIKDVYSKNDFTLLTFFSPSCQHCIDKMPENRKFALNLKIKYPNNKIEWVTILNDYDETNWEDFLEKNQLDNVAINLKSIDPLKTYQNLLNAYSNPSYFLIDQQGKIVLKSFNVKAINEIISSARD